MKTFHTFAALVSVGSLCLSVFVSAVELRADALTALTESLAVSADTQFQLDVLRGISAALKGRRQVPMPQGWDAVESKLASSNNSEVRALAQSISLTFGSQQALGALRKTLVDSTADLSARQAALDALLSVKEASLSPTLRCPPRRTW